MSGKSSVIVEMLKCRRTLFESDVSHLIFFCGIPNKKLETEITEMGIGVETFEGVDQLEHILKSKESLSKTVVLLDDLQDVIFENRAVSKLMTVWAHHLNIAAVIVTSQSLYQGGKFQTTFNRNLSHYILCRHFRMVSIVTTLSRQLHLGDLPSVYKTQNS